MLVLARKTGESIVINDDIVIRVLDSSNGQVRLGIEAPATIPVHRQEVYQRIIDENKKAAAKTPADLTELHGLFSDIESGKTNTQNRMDHKK